MRLPVADCHVYSPINHMILRRLRGQTEPTNLATANYILRTGKKRIGLFASGLVLKVTSGSALSTSRGGELFTFLCRSALDPKATEAVSPSDYGYQYDKIMLS